VDVSWRDKPAAAELVVRQRRAVMEVLMLKNVLVVLMAVGWVVGCAHHAQNEAMSSEPPEAEQAVLAASLEEAEGDVEVPPEGALPLSEIIANLEVGAHVTIVEVEYEDGAWEVEYVVGDEVHELRADPMTGEAFDDEADEPDAG
jgi:hypothetical protein